MTAGPGLGGTPEKPPGYTPPDQPGVAAGSPGIIRARQVIIVGTGGELLVFTPTQAAGNLIASIAGAAFTDQLSEHVLQAIASYGAGFASALAAGFLQFYSGSLAGGWTARGSIQGDSLGDILILPSAGRQVTTNNQTLDDGLGNLTAAGTGVFNGSGITVGNGAAANVTLVPKMATPPNLAAVVAGTATLAQTEACLGAIVQSMQNRGLVN